MIGVSGLLAGLEDFLDGPAQLGVTAEHGAGRAILELGQSQFVDPVLERYVTGLVDEIPGSVVEVEFDELLDVGSSRTSART